MNGPNKLGCFSLASLFNQVLFFSGKDVAYLSGAQGAIRLGWKSLPGTNPLAYLTHCKFGPRFRPVSLSFSVRGHIL
jgi:hypothetical protein